MHHLPEFRRRNVECGNSNGVPKALSRCGTGKPGLHLMHDDSPFRSRPGGHGCGPPPGERVWRRCLDWGGLWLFCAGTLVVMAVWMRLILAAMGVLVLV